MKHKSIQEAIIIAKVQPAEITGCTKESIIGMIQDIYRDLGHPCLFEFASNATKLANTRFKYLYHLIENLRTQSPDLAKIIESTEKY